MDLLGIARLILDSDSADLDSATRKLRTQFQSGLVVVAESGYLGPKLYIVLLACRTMAPADNEEVEGANSLIKNISTACPRIDLPLLAARICIKKHLGVGDTRGSSTRHDVLFNRAATMCDNLVDYVVSGSADDIQHRPTRWCHPPPSIDADPVATRSIAIAAEQRKPRHEHIGWGMKYNSVWCKTPVDFTHMVGFTNVVALGMPMFLATYKFRSCGWFVKFAVHKLDLIGDNMHIELALSRPFDRISSHTLFSNQFEAAVKSPVPVYHHPLQWSLSDNPAARPPYVVKTVVPLPAIKSDGPFSIKLLPVCEDRLLMTMRAKADTKPPTRDRGHQDRTRSARQPTRADIDTMLQKVASLPDELDIDADLIDAAIAYLDDDAAMVADDVDLEKELEAIIDGERESSGDSRGIRICGGPLYQFTQRTLSLRYVSITTCLCDSFRVTNTVLIMSQLSRT